MADEELSISKIPELRVIDLRAELEKRGLSKNGVKAELIERLTLAVQQGTPSILNLSNSSNSSKGEEAQATTTHDSSLEDTTISTEGQSEESFCEDDKPQDDQEKEQPNHTVTSGSMPTETLVAARNNEMSMEKEDQSKENEETSLNQLAEGSEDLPKIKLSTQIFEEVGNDLEHDSKLESRTFTPTRVEQDMESGLDRSVDEDILIVNEPITGSLENVEEPNSTAKNGSNDALGTSVNEVASDQNDQSMESGKSTLDASGSGTESSAEIRSTNVSEESKPERKTSGTSNSEVQTLVVSGFTSNTRASDIREAFRRFGKISGVKIISNSRAEGSTRFAHVTISTKDGASACIAALHNSELFGTPISVSKVQGNALEFVKELNSQRTNAEAVQPEKTNVTKEGGSTAPEAPGSTTTTEEIKDSETNLDTSTGTEGTESKEDTDKKKEKVGESSTHVEKLEATVVSRGQKSEKDATRHESTRRDRDDSKQRSSREARTHHRTDPYRRQVEVRLRSPNHRPTSTYKGGASGRTYYTRDGRSYRGPPYDTDRSEHRLTFEKIRKTREDAIRRDYERKEREREQRKLREEEERQRAIQRRNEMELRKLEEEREKLRREREKVEREKQELIRLEKLRQQVERERIEKEKEELRRAQLKLAQKRGLAKERGRYDDYPEAKKSHVESHRVAPSSHSHAESSSTRSRHEPTRRVESVRHDRGDREGLRVEVDFERSRERPRERDHGHRSSSREKRVDSKSRNKAPEFNLPRAPKPPIIGKPAERVSRDFSTTHSSSSRSDTYRAPDNAADDNWSRNSYGSSSQSKGQANDRNTWSSSNRKPVPMVSNERQVRVEPGVDRWNTGNVHGAGFVNRTSPSLLNQHVLNPHAGHMGMGGAAPANNSGFSHYNKIPGGQYRRY